MKEEKNLIVNGTEWKGLQDKAYEKVSKSAKVDGFRPGKAPRDMYEKKYGKQPAQKPVELLKRIIRASTSEGDLILDPFCGSSTTGVACKQLDRKYIGIDNVKEYLDLSIKRIQD